MNNRKKILELFSKQLSEGIPFAEDFITTDADIENNSLLARNLSEDTLAHQALKNTGLSVPDNNASINKKEDFLNKLSAERYPEIKDPNIRIGSEDSYRPSTGGILIKDRGDIVKEVGKTFHESAHKYDNDVLGFKGQELDLKTLRGAKKSGLDLKNMDPAEVYEVYAKGHHARIPNLRDADSFGLGALKSMLKSGTFRGIAPVVAKAGLATAGGLASLASEASDSEDVGSSAEQNAFLRERDEMVNRGNNMKNSTPVQQEALKKMYEELDSGQAFNVRRDALRKMSGK